MCIRDRTCLYVYPEGHEKAGERCGSNRYQRKEGPGKGYCYPHARKTGRISKEKIKEIIGKQKDSQLKRHSDRREEKQEVLNQSKITAEERQAKRMKSIDLYHHIMGDENFSLTEMVEEMRTNNMDITLDVHRKAMFVAWWMSDPGTREPKDMYDAGKILGVTKYVVREWVRTPWFASSLKTEGERMDMIIEPHIKKSLHILALSGDKDGVAKFYQEYKRIEVPDVKAGEDDFDPKKVKEAMEGTGILETKSGTIYLDPKGQKTQEIISGAKPLADDNLTVLSKENMERISQYVADVNREEEGDEEGED